MTARRIIAAAVLTAASVGGAAVVAAEPPAVGNDVCVEIGPEQGTFEGQPQERSYTVELPAHSAIEGLKVNGRRTRCAATDDKRFRVDIPKQNIAKSVKIQFKIK